MKNFLSAASRADVSFLRRLAALCLAVAFVSSTLLAGKDDRRLDIYWIDAEGGAATLIVTPAGESVLMDSGNPGGRDSGRIHKLATETARIDKIDFLITTHFHLDHFGGAAELAQRMPISVVYDNGIPLKNPDNRPNDTRFRLLIKPYREMKVGERKILVPGERIPLRNIEGAASIRLTCLAAKQKTASIRSLADHSALQKADGAVAESICDSLPQPHPPDTSDNANSIVTILEFGDFRFFNAGDLTWNIEPLLVCPRNIVGSTVDVYQVTHHGLDSSNNPALLQTLAPTVTVMNNGVTKGCGPKTFAALSTLPSAKAHYQLHKNLRPDRHHNTADEYIANLERNCGGHAVHLSVVPSGERYTVSIPSRNHRRSFETTNKQAAPRANPERSN